jgi:hypothetical protein
MERPQRARPRRRLILGAAAATAAAAAAALAVDLRAGGGAHAGFRAALAGTAPVQALHGEASFYRQPSGWRIELDAEALPRLDHGRYYEAWLRNRAGVLVPVGTFNEGRDVMLWAGVSPKAFTTLTITRERADGDEGSSGRTVLAGTVTPSA